MPEINPKIFKEYDIRGEYPWEIDEEAADKIARAFVKFKKIKKVVVSRDARKESRFISEAFIQSLADSGCQIFNLGIDSTSALFFAVGWGRFDGGVMVTASHNPDGFTGLKLCGADGVPIGKATGLEEIAELAELTKTQKHKNTKTHLLRDRRGNIMAISILGDYYNFATSFIEEKKIKPMKLVLDASSGSAAKLIDYVFVRLPGRVIKMNFKKGDKYPDHDLNPMLEKNRRSIQKEVKKQKAHLGIIWDGDGDRCLFIDEKGNFIEPYHLNCLLSQIILSKKKRVYPIKYPVQGRGAPKALFNGVKIFIDARLPVGISEVINKAGGRPVVGVSGYTNIIKLMREKKILFGCENSGHYFFNFSANRRMKKDGRNFVYSDAIIPTLLILEYLSETNLEISQALAPFRKKYFVSGELNFKVHPVKYPAKGRGAPEAQFNGVKNFERLKEKIKREYGHYQTEEIDGVSVSGKDWFFNIRASKTEALVRVNIEARNKEDLAGIKKELLKVMR